MKVLTYNINDGKGLDAAAETLRSQAADIVLLNEVQWVPTFPFRPTNARNDQTRYLANVAGYTYHKYWLATFLGFRATKGVSILSRYPVRNARMHVAPGGSVFEDGYGTLQSTVDVPGGPYEVFSTRFAPLHAPDHEYFRLDAEANSRASHEQLTELVRKVPSSVPVIVGGDLNVSWTHTSPTGARPPSEWGRAFRDNSGLREVLREFPNPRGPGTSNCSDGNEGGSVGVGYIDNRVDYIYFRGDFVVEHAEYRCGSPGASDHAYLAATISENAKPIPSAEPGESDECRELRRRILIAKADLKDSQDQIAARTGPSKPAVMAAIRRSRTKLERLEMEAKERGCAGV